ncbi:MAG: type II toxin-antitoxin system VapC family toxin [bacterium]|nr:type II toxin-antitoxin system VapC family toxin [bacterium]
MDERLVLCDTNVFINLFNGNEDTLNILKKLGTQKILIPSVTVMELYQGMGNKKELYSMKKKIKHYSVLHFTSDVSRLAGKYIEEFRLSHNLQIPDAIIAASAVNFDLPLFTYNLKDFRFIPNIELYRTGAGFV